MLAPTFSKRRGNSYRVKPTTTTRPTPVVDAQNALTQTVLAQCETHDKFKALMTRLYDYPRYGCPSKRGERYVYSHNTGLQAQSVLYSAPTPAGEPTVLLDANKLSKDGTERLGDGFGGPGGRMGAREGRGRAAPPPWVPRTGQPPRAASPVSIAQSLARPQVSLTRTSFSKDGKMMAYALSRQVFG